MTRIARMDMPMMMYMCRMCMRFDAINSMSTRVNG